MTTGRLKFNRNTTEFLLMLLIRTIISLESGICFCSICRDKKKWRDCTTKKRYDMNGFISNYVGLLCLPENLTWVMEECSLFPKKTFSFQKNSTNVQIMLLYYRLKNSNYIVMDHAAIILLFYYLIVYIDISNRWNRFENWHNH